MTARMPRFLIRRDAAVGDRVELDADEAKHARVRRLRSGDTVALFDGTGRSFTGRLQPLSRDSAAVVVTEVLRDRDGESALDLALAIGVLKANRLEWVIEKATELGVTRILPFVSHHSLARPSPARQARWRHIALSAVKQSGRSVPPDIATPLSWEALLTVPASVRVLCWEAGGRRTVRDLPPTLPHSGPATLIVGPEGGFADAEVEAARAAGCHLIGLGPRILRAETAAIGAVALCQHLWGDLSAAARRAR